MSGKDCKCGKCDCEKKDLDLDDLTFCADMPGAKEMVDQVYQATITAFKLLAQRHGGSVAFSLGPDGQNVAEFDIPPENKSAFDEELIELVNSMDGAEITDDE